MADTPTAPAAPVSLPPLPPAWSDVLAAAQKAGADAPTIRAGFQKWSADTLNAVRASNAPTPIRQQVNTFIANQYDQFEQPSYWESIGQAVKSIPSSLGSLAITPGAAIHDAATEAGQAIAGTAGTDVGTPDEQGVIAPTAGRKTAVLAQQVATGYQPLLNRVGQVLAHGARIGDIVNAAGAPDYQAESQRVDQFFNSLDTRIDSGQPLSKAFLTQWGDLVKGSAAKANGESPATYNEPDRDPTNAENLKLIAAYAATKDPVYRNALKAKMTIPGVIKEANAEQENTPVGALPDWARSVVEGAGDPINLAATAATIFPLTAPEGAAAKLTLATLGKAAGEGALKGATVMAPLNVAQTAIQNPNATDAQLEQAGTSGLVAGALMGGVAHAAPVVFKGIKDARINAKLTEMGLTPEQFAQMDKNRQEQAATEAARQNAQEEYKQLQNQHSQQTNEGGPEISPPPPEGFGHPGKKVLIGNVLSQRGAIAPDPVAQRAAQIQDALDASYEHNSPFTPVYADEAATEARMAKAFQPGPEYTPDAHTTTKLEALIPRAVQAGLMNLAENDYRTPLQLAIDSQHTMGTKDAAAAAQVLENHLAQEDRIRQSPQGSVLLRQQLQAQSEGLGPEATPPQPQAINIAAPSPEQAISEGKAATGGGKAGAAAGLNIAASQPSSPINIAAVVNDPTIHIADIATHPALDKIPVEQKANLQVAAALSPSRAEGQQTKAISKPEPTTPSITEAPAITNVPVNRLKLSTDVPQFKSDADAKGVVEPLQGKFDRRGLGPIQIWERLNGDQEVISGRHRLDLAQRTGQAEIPAQVYREADGFTAQHAARLDAELNIRDGNGTTADYANYFRNSGITPEDAQARGLLARAKGQAGFSIGNGASEDVFALHQAKKLTDAQAQAISEAAPNDPGLQAVGTRAALDDKSADYSANLIKAAKLTVDARRAAGDQGDLFGFDDSAMKQMEAQAKKATEIQNGLREQINAVKGAVKNPEKAKGGGVNVKSVKASAAKLADWQAQLDRWQNWPTEPDLVAQAKGQEIAQESPVISKPPRPQVANNKTGQYALLGEDEGGFQLAGDKGVDTARIAAEEEVRKNAQAEAEKSQTGLFEQPTGEQPNATQTRQNENQLQHQGTSPRPAVPADEGQVRPGNGESPSSGGGSEPSAKGKVAKVPRAKTPYGRRGSVIIPDFLEEGTKRIGNAIARGDTVDKISAEKDAANQQADIEARKQANDIRGALSRALPGFYTKGKVLSRELLSRKVILPEDATTLLQETESGNIGPRLNKTEALGALDRQAATIRASTKADPAQAKRALDAIQFAKDNYDKLAPIVQLADSKYDQQHQIENRFGLQSPYRKGYVFHAQDIENPEGFDSSGGGSGPNSRFRLGRTHDTYADSIANGVKYHTLSAPDLLESRIRNGSKIINNTAWVDALRNINDPINKAPLTAPIQIVSRVNGPDYETVPRGYTKVDLLGRRVGIQDPYVKLVQALSSPSAFENEQLGRLLREGSQLKKSVMTTLDSYHLGWGAWRAITAKLGSLDNPIPTVRSLKGRLALDFSPEEAQRLAAAGQIPKAWLDNIAERSRISQVLVKNGLLPGRGTDALHQELTQRLPILGSANRYIFDGFIRSAINEIGTREFQVQRKMFPNLSEDQLARKVSGEVNNFMGNVGSRGIFKSKTFQDLARIATLAPGLTEGKLRSEIGAPIQALQTIPQSIRAGRPAAGLYARGTAAALIASFTAAQVLNLYFRGYPTWQNKEEGHDAKVSGYIPDAVGGGPGLFYDPLEAAAPTIAQLHDIYARTGDVGKTAVQFARDKSGPLVSPLFDLSGIGPTGKPLKSGVTSAALGYIPAPIAGHVAYDAAKQLITGKHAETYPGEFERQGLSSLGIRTTSVPAPEQRISQLVQNFKKANNIPTFTPGGEDDNPYMALTSALRVNNQSDAKQALADILQKKTLEQVQNYFVNYPLHTLTGSEKNDEKFKATLNPEQVKALDAATASRTKLAQSALQLLSQQPGAGKEMFNLAADAMQKHQESQALNSIATKILANPTGDTARAAINDGIKNGTVPTVNGQPDPGFIKRLDTAYAAMVKAKNEDAQIKDIAKLGASSTDAARAKEIYRIITQDLHTPEDRAKFGQQLMAAKLLTPIVKQQLNLLAQREQQQPQAVGQ